MGFSLRGCFSLILCDLNMICLGVNFLIYILLHVLWASPICVLVSLINFWKFSAIITSSIYSVLFFLLVFPLNVCYIFCNCSTVFGYSDSYFLLFFLFAFPFWSFYQHIFKPSDFLLGPVPTTDNSMKAFFMSIPGLSTFSSSFWSFLEFPFLCLYYPSVLECCQLFPLELLVY